MQPGRDRQHLPSAFVRVLRRDRLPPWLHPHRLRRWPDLQSAEQARKEMQSLKSDNDKLLAEARAERDAMLKEAREIKEKMINDAKTEAQTQGHKMIEQAKTAIESEKNAALAELKSHVATLSLDIAEKLLKNELSDKSAQVKLVEKMLDDVKLS